MDALVALGEGAFELLERFAMGGFPVAELDFQSMHTVLRRLHLLHLSPEVVSISEAFVELGDVLAQDPDFLLQHLLGLFGGLTSLLGSTDFLRLVGNNQIEIAHALTRHIGFSF